MASEKMIITVPHAEKWARKSWAKVLTHVDVEKTNGFAFEGDWLAVGRKVEVPVGAIILVHSDTGNPSAPFSVVKLFRVSGSGDFELLAEASGRDWVLELRDKAAALVNAQDKELNALAGFTDDELINELRRRGYSVTKC